MKKLLSLLLVLAMVFTLAACGGKDSKKKKDDDVAGKYYLASATIDGDKVKSKNLEKTYGEDCYLEIKDNGKATFHLNGEKLKMEWEDGEIWYKDADDETFELEFDGDELVLTMEIDDEENVLTFEKEADDDEDEDNDKSDKKDKDDKDEDAEYEEDTDNKGNAVERLPETMAPSYEDDSVAGTYYFYSITMDGETHTIDELEEGEMEAYITLYSDGTAYMYTSQRGEDMGYDENSIWPLSDPDEIADMEIDGDTLTIESDDLIMVFEK